MQNGIGKKDVTRCSVFAMAVLAATLGATIAIGQEGAGETHAGPGNLTLSLEHAPVAEFLRRVGQASGLNVVVEFGTPLPKEVTIQAKDRPWKEALGEVFQAAGLAYYVEGSLLWIHDASDEKAPQTFSGQPIDLDLKEADIREALADISQRYGLKLMIDPEIEGSVTLFLKEVPWDQAFDAILKIKGLSFSVDQGQIHIHDAG